MTWRVAANDSYFSPELSRKLVEAFHAGGDKVGYRVLPASGSEGHWMVETENGVRLAAAKLERAVTLQEPRAIRNR